MTQFLLRTHTTTRIVTFDRQVKATRDRGTRLSGTDNGPWLQRTRTKSGTDKEPEQNQVQTKNQNKITCLNCLSWLAFVLDILIWPKKMFRKYDTCKHAFKKEKLKNKIFKKVQDRIQYAMQAETEFFFF